MFALAIVRSTADLPEFRRQLARLHEARARAGATDPPLSGIWVHGGPVPADVATWFEDPPQSGDAARGFVAPDVTSVGHAGLWTVLFVAGDAPSRADLTARLARRSATSRGSLPEIEAPSFVVLREESEGRARSESSPRSTRSSWGSDADPQRMSRRGNDPIVAGDRS